MRHLTGIVLAIVLTTGLFFAVTWGYVRLAAQSPQLPDRASLLSDHHALLALGALAAIGLLAGILIAAPRVSPLAAGLPGLLLLGLTALHLASVHRADQLIPLKSQVFGMGFETLLTRGMLGAAGAAMIVPLFVPSRWRGRDGADIAGGSGRPGLRTPSLPGLLSRASATCRWPGQSPGRTTPRRRLSRLPGRMRRPAWCTMVRCRTAPGRPASSTEMPSFGDLGQPAAGVSG